MPYTGILRPDITVADAQYSASVWQYFDGRLPNVDYKEVLETFEKGIVTGSWTLTQNGAGAWAAQASEAGIIGQVRIDTGDATQYHGPNIQLTNAGLFIPAAGKRIAFETRVRVTTALGDLFIGLAGINTTVLTTNAHTFTETNTIGFQCLTGDRILLGRADKAATADTTTFNGGTALTLATYYNLGFVVDGTKSVTYYLNGVAQADKVSTGSTNIPTAEALLLSFASQNYTTTRCYLDVQWVRAAMDL